MGWLIAIVILLCLLLLPVGVSAVYDEHLLNVWLLTGPVRLHVYPKKSNGRKSAAKKSKTTCENSEKGGSYRLFLQAIKPILAFLDHFRRKIRVTNLELKLILAGDEPDRLAIICGGAWAALGNLLPHFERAFVIKKRNINVGCDFSAEETLIYARLDATITVARAIYLLTGHGIEILKQLVELKNLRKGGAQQ